MNVLNEMEDVFARRFEDLSDLARWFRRNSKEPFKDSPPEIQQAYKAIISV